MAWPDSALGTEFPTLGEEITGPILDARITANLNSLQAAIYAGYTSYTPALTTTGTAATLGTAPTQLGVYKIVGGKICVFSALWVWGTTPTAGTGTYLMGLPVAWANDGISTVFTSLLIAGGNNYTMTGLMASTTTLQFVRGDGTTNVLDPTHPTAPASGNSLRVNGSYRTA